MKKVVIMGANGSLAKFVIDALEKLEDVQLTLFVRNKNNLPSDRAKKHTVIEGNALNYNQILAAIEKQDFVYVNLAGDLGKMARNIVDAMKELGVARIVAISSIGIYDEPFKPVLRSYRELADTIEGSGLAYTILRPDWFTNGDEVDYQITYKGQAETGSAISRKSIAAFVADLVKDPEAYINENLGISRP